MRTAALFLALLAAAPAASAGTGRLSGAQRWACFYGARMSATSWNGLDMAIVESDAFVRPSTAGPAALAYVSAGEAESGRWYWAQARGKPYLVEPNPDWPGSYRTDIRSPDWRALLLDTVISSALAKGYDGVMLDTLDTAEYLESSAPLRFAGSRDAAVGFILELRRRLPEALIVVNNALPLLDAVGEAVDGVLVEDLYTRCRPDPGPCGPTPEEVTLAKETALHAFSAKTGKPVFVLLYSRVKDRDAPWVRAAVRRARESGFIPYLSSPTLMRLGVVAPGAGP